MNDFSDDEREAFRLVLRRMADEMKPRYPMRPEAQKAYAAKTEHAADRVLCWLETLSEPEIETTESFDVQS